MTGGWKIKAAVMERTRLGITTQILAYFQISSLEFMELHRTWSKTLWRSIKCPLPAIWPHVYSTQLSKILLFKVALEHILKSFGSQWDANTCLDLICLSNEGLMLVIILLLFWNRDLSLWFHTEKACPLTRNLFIQALIL